MTDKNLNEIRKTLLACKRHVENTDMDRQILGQIAYAIQAIDSASNPASPKIDTTNLPF